MKTLLAYIIITCVSERQGDMHVYQGKGNDGIEYTCFSPLKYSLKDTIWAKPRTVAFGR